MVGAPGFLAALGDLKASREVVKFLEYILYLDFVAEMLGVDFGLELLLKAVADYKHHLAKASADGVGNRVIHNDFTIRAYSVHLFQSTVAATHSSRKY